MKYNLKTGRLMFEMGDKVKHIKSKQKNDVAIQMPILKMQSSVNSVREKLATVRHLAVQTAALLVMIVLIAGTVSALDITFAKEVLVEGYPIGLVEHTHAMEQMVSDTEAFLQQALGQPVDASPQLAYITRLVLKRQITDDYTLRQNLLSTYPYVANAYAIYADGQLLCAALEEQSAQNALEQIKQQYAVQQENATVEFVQNVTIQREFVPVSFLKKDEALPAALMATKETVVPYTVQANDTLWSVANKFQTTAALLQTRNSHLGETLNPGDVVNIVKEAPVLTVRTCYMVDEVERTPYENTELSSNKLAAGMTEVVTPGKEGKRRVVAQVVALNGEIIEKNVLQEEVLEQPIAGVVRVGTRSTPTLGTGEFVRPIYGTVTSRFGSRRRGNHTGIDYAAPVGTPIKAADNGVVTTAEWSGGYGYLVVIDHGNGVETYYAHNSEICVSVGQHVNKGDVICKVGNTGNSTGAHCHFEIRKDGVPQNPETYVN